jgi:hypothetical protein
LELGRDGWDGWFVISTFLVLDFLRGLAFLFFLLFDFEFVTSNFRKSVVEAGCATLGFLARCM